MKLNEQKMDPSKFVGKTANLYFDKNNENFGGQLKITNIRPAKETLKNNELGTTYIWEMNGLLKEFGKKNSNPLTLFYICGKPPVQALKVPGPGLFVKEYQGKGMEKQVYSVNLENELSKFCIVSKGGAVVPKADFVSADVTSDEPMAEGTEGKRVIRLTESDLIKLVKRVIEEQGEPAPVSKPQPVEDKGKDLVGKTVNVYLDPENKMFVYNTKIQGVEVSKNGTGDVMIKFDRTPNAIPFRCGNDFFIDKKSKLYSKNFTSELNKRFCTKSRGGTPVPSADFAKSNTSTSDIA